MYECVISGGIPEVNISEDRKTITFNNLIDTNTGKRVEIELDEPLSEIAETQLIHIGKRAYAFGKRLKSMIQ